MIVRGVRTCRWCKGICHESSWRQRHGQRRGYWCSEAHLREQVSLPLEDDDNFYLMMRDLFYEPVEVITR